MNDAAELLDEVTQQLLAALLSNMYETSTSMDEDRPLVYDRVNKYRARGFLFPLVDHLAVTEEDDDPGVLHHFTGW